MAFVADYIEILRAAPFLKDLPLSEAVARLHQLHQRHGRAVAEVVKHAISSSSSSLAARLALPDSSLLAMIIGSQAQDIVCRDPVEREPSAATQAGERPLCLLQRPITFSVAEKGGAVVFAGSVTLRGRAAALVTLMLPNFVAANYMTKEQIASALGTTEGALRTLISRAREDLTEQFLRIHGVSLGTDDVIQNNRWDGYRLNPGLAYVPQNADDEATIQAAE